MDLKYIVYVTVNLCNGKLYFGVHKTNPDTFDGYIGDGIYRQSSATENYPFHRAVRKYGYENFKRTTIATFPNTEEGREQAYALEAAIVNITFLKSKNTYNIQVGGLGGTGYTSKPVYQFALNGNFIKKWNSVKEASTTLNILHIDRVCNGHRDSAGGYYWSYKKEFKYCPFDNRRRVAQYTISGKFIRTWDCKKEAETELGIVNIHTAIKLKRTCGGYQWRYFEGDTSDITPFKSKTGYKQYYMGKVEQYSPNNELIKVWDSMEQLEENGFNRTYVRNVIKGFQKTYKGYIFKMQDKDIVSTSNENQSCESVPRVTTQVEGN